MKKRVKSKHSHIWTIIGISLIVAVIVSIAALSITGNAIKVRGDNTVECTRICTASCKNAKVGSSSLSCYDNCFKACTGSAPSSDVYTKGEVDKLLENRRCEYVHYKDNDLNGVSFDGKFLWEACSKYNLKPKMTTRYFTDTLYNGKDCSPSYNIFSTNSHLIGRVGSSDKLGGQPTFTCSNTTFSDGKLNSNFSSESSWFIDGVICC